jgi:hypothetical protein
MRKAVLLSLVGSILLLLSWYFGIPAISQSPPGPNFAVLVGVVKFPESISFPQPRPEEWLLRAVGRWPEADIHLIEDKNGACAAHIAEEPQIVYRPTLRAHITGFRMFTFLNRASFNPGSFDVGWPHFPVLQRLTLALEKDCGDTYDLIVFPFGVLERATVS